MGIGCRFSDRHTGALDVYTKGRKFIHINIDPTQIGLIIPADLGIVADAKHALRELLSIAKETNQFRRTDERIRNLPIERSRCQRVSNFDQVPIKPQRVFKEINEFFDEDTIFVTCIGLNQIWSG